MKAIKRLVNKIDEELAGAQSYAEMYVEEKSEGNTEWAKEFREMAEDELKHSGKIHDYAVMKINKLKEVYTPSQEMLDKWEESHKNYVDKAAWIKQMLAM